MLFGCPLPTIEEGKRLLQVLCHTQDVEIESDLFEHLLKVLWDSQKKKYNDVSRLIGSHFWKVT